MHSLESHKQRDINTAWQFIWLALNDDECRRRALIIETSQLTLILDQYLRKHKFCSDCKLKVIRAYNLLTCPNNNTCVDNDSNDNNNSNNNSCSKDKSYLPALYDGITMSSNTTTTTTTSTTDNECIHIRNDKQLILNLISKAESELQGQRRERHAKTIEIAQEEVLTCIGLYLHERFQRIYSAFKSEEQTWHLVFYSSVLTLRKCFECEFEKCQGVSNLELICAELNALDESRLTRKQLKRENKRKNKQINNKNKQTIIKFNSDEEDSNEEEEYGDNNNNSNNKIAEQFKCSRSTSASSIIYLVEEGEEEEEEVYEDIDVECIDCKNDIINNNNNDNNNSTDICSTCINNNSKIDLNKIDLFNSMSSSSSYSSTSSSSAKNNSNLLLGHQAPPPPPSPSMSAAPVITEEMNKEFNFTNLNDLIVNSMSNSNSNSNYITDEEKMEYYANRDCYLNERQNRREMLEKKFQNLKLSANFKILKRKNI